MLYFANMICHLTNRINHKNHENVSDMTTAVMSGTLSWCWFLHLSIFLKLQFISNCR